MPELARTHQVAGIAVKNEQERLGLPSFKLLGSSWALHERVKAAAGLSPDALIAFPDLSRIARGLGPPTLCTASDGNHGRAVAALAEALGCGCVVLLSEWRSRRRAFPAEARALLPLARQSRRSASRQARRASARSPASAFYRSVTGIPERDTTVRRPWR